MSKIKVIIVDDSAVVRQVNRQTLERASGIEVIAVCSDPVVALEKMAQNWPDVIVTDIEMPRMDGIRFIKHVMSYRPTPIVVCSSLTQEGASTTLEALSAGALSIITKPQLGIKQFLQEAGQDLIQAVRGAAAARMGRIGRMGRVSQEIPMPSRAPPQSANTAGALNKTTEKIIAIGTSTGGTQALEHVLTALPRTTAGIVVVQHMPEKFTEMFAQRLNDLCAMQVSEAKCGQRVLPGQVLIAPGGLHMQLTRSGAQYQVQVRDGPRINRHKPSVDVLFRSVAQVAGANALGIIMTGMGEDGARGLLEMRSAGARTIAEDEASCVVFGMPKAAIEMGAAEKIVRLERIAQEITAYGQSV